MVLYVFSMLGVGVFAADNAAKATVSAIASYLGGPIHPVTGIPSNVVILPEAVKDGLKLRANFQTGSQPTLNMPGLLGSQHEAFNPVGGSALQKTMELRMPTEQFEDRKRRSSDTSRRRRET